MAKDKDCYWVWETKNDEDLAKRLEGRIRYLCKKDIVEKLNTLKGEILSLPNRDDEIHARILMPDGGGVNKFVVIRRIEDLIAHFK